MGHLGKVKDEYLALVRRMEGGQVAFPEPQDARAAAGWREILEILYTPEDAELASKLPTTPSSLDRISARLGVTDKAQLQARLDSMAERGLVLDLVNSRTGKVKYLLAPPVVGFFEFSMMRAHDDIPKKRMAEALEAYTHGDDTFAREVFGHDTVIGRALVNEDGVAEGISSNVLDWESATAILGEAKKIAVALCYCRHKAEHLGKACDAPQEICLSMNAGADFVIRRNFGRAVERSEALEMLHKSREAGLVQIGDNVLNKPTYICNCCGCCCGQLQSINEFDLRGVSPSGYVAKPEIEKCAGCSRCSRACPIAAIAMAPERVEATRKNKLRPHVDEEKCIGCGVCTTACHKDSMKMHRRAKQPHVPANSIERAVRMSIERGRLAQLLFDEGEGRGMRFLNQAMRALMSLPLAQRTLASKQVSSRFVKATLGMVQDPTGG